ALAHDGAVIVVPARAAEAGKSLALYEGALRIGIRVDEDVTVIERRDQPDHARAQHAVAEDIAAHVADAHDSEWLRLRVAAHLAEVAAHALPRAARGDADVLVAVAVRAAGCECVVEPEAVLRGNGVRDVRELRRALVGRAHEVRVVLVGPDAPRRTDALAVAQVVRDVEQPADEGAILLLHLGRDIPGRARQHRRDEAALRAGRHDHRVL